MIRGRQQHERVRIGPRRHQRGDAGGWRGASACGLKHDLCRLCRRCLELVGDQKAMLLVCKNRQAAEQIAGKPAAGLLEQRIGSGDLVKRLG